MTTNQPTPGHYHDPEGKYDYCADPKCPRAYRMQDDVELLADRYVRKTSQHRPVDLSESPERSLLSKRQVDALLRDAYVAGQLDARANQET